MERRRPRLRIFAYHIFQRFVAQARRAKALRASVSRRPCATKKKDTRRKPPGVESARCLPFRHCRSAERREIIEPTLKASEREPEGWVRVDKTVSPGVGGTISPPPNRLLLERDGW